MNTSPRRRAPRWAAAAVVVALAVAGAVWLKNRAAARADTSTVPVPAAAQARTGGTPASPAAQPVLPAGATKAYADFERVPFAVSHETNNNQWTAEDGMRADVIAKLAHNPLEETRMLEENSRIKARQLVYRKVTVGALVQQARLTGEKIDHLVLPALDGQELPVKITSTDLSASGQSGTLTGYVAGRPDTTVTVAFKFGREAFTVLSPADGNSYDAEPREPGQVVVKSIDPEVYIPWKCGVEDAPSGVASASTQHPAQ